MRRDEGALLGQVCARRRARRSGQDSSMEHRRPAQGLVLDGQWDHHRLGAPLAAHDRPADAGEQVGQEDVQVVQPGHLQALRRRLCARARERAQLWQPDAPRERPGGARPRARAGVAQADLQVGRRALDQARRLGRRVQQELQVLHHDQAAQPALPARGLGQGDAAQLHDHARGARGPDARHRGRQGAPRARGGEDEARARGRAEQARAQGGRGQDPAHALLVRGQHPRRRVRHRDPRRCEGHLGPNLGQAGDRRQDHPEARRHPRELQVRRVPLVHPLLLDRRDGEHRPDVPILPRLVPVPLREGHRAGRALEEARRAPQEHHQDEHVLRLPQCVPLALREGQAALLLRHVHQHHARRQQARRGPVHLLPHGRHRHHLRQRAQEPDRRRLHVRRRALARAAAVGGDPAPLAAAGLCGLTLRLWQAAQGVEDRVRGRGAPQAGAAGQVGLGPERRWRPL